MIFQNILVPVVNKSTRVTKNNATPIDYTIFYSFTDKENLTGILKTDISVHCLIFAISMKLRFNSSNRNVTVRKRVVNADSIQESRDDLSEVD